MKLFATMILSLFLVSYSHASIIEFNWTTQVDSSSLSLWEAGDSITIEMLFDIADDDYASHSYTFDEFISYTATNSYGDYVTAFGYGGYNGAYFETDLNGNITSVGNNRSNYYLPTESNIGMYNQKYYALFITSANQSILSVSGGQVDVVNRAAGLQAESWTVSGGVSVPEPSTLAIFALGMMGLALRRFKKKT